MEHQTWHRKCKISDLFSCSIIVSSQCESGLPWKWTSLKMKSLESGRSWKWTTLKMNGLEIKRPWKRAVLKVNCLENGWPWKSTVLKVDGLERERPSKWAALKGATLEVDGLENGRKNNSFTSRRYDSRTNSCSKCQCIMKWIMKRPMIWATNHIFHFNMFYYYRLHLIEHFQIMFFW